MTSVIEPQQVERCMAGCSRKWRRLLVFGVVGVAAPAVSVAEPGDHIRPTKNLVISPGIGLSLDFHSNIFLADGTTVNSQGVQSVAVPGVSITPKPHIELLLDRTDVDLKTTADYTPRIFPSGLWAASSFPDHKINVDLDVLPESTLGFGIEDHWGITTRLTEIESDGSLGNSNSGSSGGDYGVVSDPETRRLSNDLSAGIAFHPGSALQATLNGLFDWERWEMPPELNSAGEYYYNSKVVYGTSLDATWRFFPSTQVVFDGSLEFNDWDRNIVSTEGVTVDDETVCNSEFGCFLPKADSTAWRAMIGLEGQVTDKISLNLLVGYGQALNNGTSVEEAAAASGVSVDALAGYDEDVTGLGGLLSLINLRYSPFDGHQLLLGYQKNFRDTYYTNDITYWSLFAQYRMSLVDKIEFTALGGYRYDGHVGYVGTNILRADHVIRVKGSLSYQATKWLEVGGGAGWDRRASAVGRSADEYDDVWVNLFADFTY